MSDKKLLVVCCEMFAFESHLQVLCHQEIIKKVLCEVANSASHEQSDMGRVVPPDKEDKEAEAESSFCKRLVVLYNLETAI